MPRRILEGDVVSDKTDNPPRADTSLINTNNSELPLDEEPVLKPKSPTEKPVEPSKEENLSFQVDAKPEVAPSVAQPEASSREQTPERDIKSQNSSSSELARLESPSR